MATNIKKLDPVQGLIDYTNDVKPYHTKVIEALVEYVSTDNVDVTILDTLEINFDLIYDFDGILTCDSGGYGTPYFGDPVGIVVASPDEAQTLQEYPALTTGYFIVLGDKRNVFDSIDDLDLFIVSQLEEKMIGVVTSTGVPPTSGASFTILGDKTTNYPISTAFKVTGSLGNDGDYTVTAVTFIPAVGAEPDQTKITVDGEDVTSDAVSGFIALPDPQNTGTFAPTASIFEPHNFNPHTKVFVTGISLVLPPVQVDENQRYVSFVNTTPLTLNKILSYSKIGREYVSTPPGTFIDSNEGTSISDIIAVTSTSFSVKGDFQSSNIFIGDLLTVKDAASNDGEYEITGINYDGGTLNTEFTVTPPPPNAGTVIGSVVLFMPSNVLIIEDNDYTRFFLQGTRAHVTVGTNIGTFSILNSRFYDKDTYVRVREPLIKEGTGTEIISIDNTSIFVDGDVSAIYPTGKQFNIVSSVANDGSYSVSVNSSYNAGTNTTQISIVEPFIGTDNSGEIHEFAQGSIEFLPSGFGASLDFCEYIPETLTSSVILDDMDLLLGYRIIITGTQASTKEIYLEDLYGDVFISLTTTTTIEIVEGGINDGVYNIINITQDVGVSAIVEVTEPLTDSGSFDPLINSGFALYEQWFQYLIVDIDTGNNDFLVSGDATTNITNGMVIEMLEPSAPYTVDAVPVFDGVNTIISVTEPIVPAAPTILTQWIISV